MGLRPPLTEQAGKGLRSVEFDDIYFQPEDGTAESSHVFLEGNDLPERFAAMDLQRPFVIGELGFGTGLNCLTAMKMFLDRAPREGRLELWSVEGYPFSPLDFTSIAKDHGQRTPALADLAARLSHLYPVPRPGLARLDLSPRLTLTLAFGDVDDLLERSSFAADAWFLDGFAPSRNPAMWSPSVLRAVADHTRPGGTFATFTVAGAVRRGMEAAGFSLARRAGYGKKREMLTGRLGQAQPSIQSGTGAVKSIAIIGAGIAGAAFAHGAHQAGFRPILIDRGEAGNGASGNPVGLLMPRLEAADNPAARFYRDAFFYALRFYWDHTPEALSPLGGTLACDGTRYKKICATGLWADEDFAVIDGVTLHSPHATLLRPRDAVTTLIEEVEVIRGEVIDIFPSDNGLTCTLTNGPQQRVEADHMILTAGPGSALISPLITDLSASRGQIDLFATSEPPRSILTADGYVAPYAGAAQKGGIAAGATYDDVPLDHDPRPTKASSEINRRMAEALMTQRLDPPFDQRAALRAVTTDRHPMLGVLGSTRRQADDPINTAILGVITGLGSRGLVTAPLMAASLIATLTGGVQPIERQSLRLLSPHRFAERRDRRAGHKPS
ncbi:hypothetical protein PB2503_06487 [Parvularcula bermudensis HTCC2503]|uniref:tRNA 5-methylaminomethyl-2-thiouridine biosynthesis bifunctional protein MnmC n=1 Tax=Parvularcula bermudensis (strain ATCC BAA-594 / HTCC2503 / KCTC 12087) TaxID=314260 RepID=E0TI24_PARBH|nr:tRNA (5-methylaminomethyl-2-thiouridine)(34)-methyltransferase MnmD [Parvularcula bermudensis]ADM09363.1 hypothetical protein PB2503_06487 [Parvularcula bermudensis HTCC2503]